jgi:uncharacterized protein YecE (DUF72 family)
MARRQHPPSPTPGVRIGCSGWNYRAWRDQLYPAGVPSSAWLGLYAQCFDTVEVNTTFYRLVSREAVARWVQQTPDGFTFAVKASRYLTHIRRLRDLDEGVGRLLERIEPLLEAGRLTALLWQLPENFHRDDARLGAALERLPAEIRHAFEFRHRSWFTPPVYAMLRERGAALVIADAPDRPCEVVEPSVGWRYVRFHHGRRGRRGNYSERELAAWARRLRRWGATDEVLVYFNNDWEAFAPRNARALERRLEGRSTARAGRRDARARGPTAVR